MYVSYLITQYLLNASWHSQNTLYAERSSKKDKILYHVHCSNPILSDYTVEKFPLRIKYQQNHLPLFSKAPFNSSFLELKSSNATILSNWTQVTFKYFLFLVVSLSYGQKKKWKLAHSREEALDLQRKNKQRDNKKKQNADNRLLG